MAYYFVNSAERDTILQGQQPLRDWESLNSENNMFRLQFFSPGNSNSRYLGIFSEGDKQAVWIANRNTPIADTSGSLMVDTDGKLKIMYNGGNVLISNSAPIARNASATLQDDGNFVLREMNLNGSINGTLWQSFDYPTDTFLPGMKLGIDFKTGHHWSLTCWISDDVPSPGTYTIGGDPNGTNQLTIWWQGNVYWTSGLWHDGHFNNSPQLSSDDYVRFSYISNQNEKYLTYSVNNVPMTYFRIYPSGIVWKTFGQQNFDKCYLPLFPDGGCKKKKLPECRKADFWFDRRVGDMDGETYRFEENYNLSIFDCQDKCEQNCLCIAFASLTLDGTGCQIWTTQQTFFSSALAKNRDIHLLVTSRGLIITSFYLGHNFSMLLPCNK
ncbi:G-type lectin S-receptor-like serine/threonine-protein kinase CES [Forsythia ovata]|uniref:G-type lectin S-receptor-like serine/threonine-protein kinase CES n=1 Tax=Forsythia ovata TaxID=205694 RepID=A0ABD1PFK2_9LAMI